MMAWCRPKRLVARPVRRLAGRLVHAGNPPAAGLARLRRIAHVDGDEDVVGEAVDQRRGIGPAPAGVPDAMDAAALDRHEADAARLGGLRDVVDGEPRGPVARGFLFDFRGADHLAELAFVIGLLVGELGGGEHVLGVDDEQQIAVGLQMDVPGAGRRGEIIRRLRVFRIAHVDDREALREHVADIGVATMHHDLHAVGPAALVGMADEPHVARVIGLRQVAHLRVHL